MASDLVARANRHAHDIRNGGYRGAADCMDALAAALKAAEAERDQVHSDTHDRIADMEIALKATERALDVAVADLAAARAEIERLYEHLRSIRHEYETSGQLSGAMLYRTTALLGEQGK
jgi:hypothetical protein